VKIKNKKEGFLMRTVISYSGTELTLNGDISVEEAREKLQLIGAMPESADINVEEYEEDGVKYVKFLKEVGEKG